MPDISFEVTSLDQPRSRAERRSKEDFPPRVRRTVASEYLWEVWGIEVASSTLAKKAVMGGGPVFHKYSQWPLYDTDDLDSYALAKLGPARSSTSEGT